MDYNIQDFCCTDGPHKFVQKPFLYNKLLYATNKNILLCVTQQTDKIAYGIVDCDQKMILLMDKLNTIKENVHEFDKFVCINDLTINTNICTKCCGLGEIESESDIIDDGEKYIYDCEDCNGGLIFTDTVIYVDNVPFTPWLLDLLKKLPGIKLLPKSLPELSYFVFDDGYGMLFARKM